MNEWVADGIEKQQTTSDPSTQTGDDAMKAEPGTESANSASAPKKQLTLFDSTCLIVGIIIGAGIIGCCTAYELSKKGYRTLNIDFQLTAGAGSTCNSCGNVRFHYSTRDGVALAYESAWYWHNWREYLDCVDERGYAKFTLGF